MPQDLTNDFLVVARHDEPPDPPTLTRAVASAGLGVLEFTPGDGAAKGGRTRLGTYTARVPSIGASARLLAFAYDGPVTTGMGEAAFAELTRGLDPADTQTLRDGAIALDLRVTAPEEKVLAALAWATLLLKTLLDLTAGAGIDPAAQRAFGRRDLARLAGQDPLAHVAFHDEAWDPESRWLHTHGLQKFGRPELDLLAVPVSLGPEAMSFLREVAASLATGARLAAGGEIDMAELGLVLAVSVAQDLDHRAPFGRLRLVDAPQPGEVEPVRVTRLLTRMVGGSATSALDTGRLDEALADADRLLVADPEDCAALLLKARILLRAGRADEALDLGDFMRLRAPSDHRGPLAAGLALAALGRPREALHRLNEAIELDPESADAYATRAEVHDRLGEQRLGAMDRARAAYLADAGQ